MQNQGITDVNSLFSQFLNKPVQNSNKNAIQTYTPIKQEQNGIRLASSLKGLAVVGAAGVGLVAIYKSGKKVGENSALKLFDEKLDGLKDELAKGFADAIKKNKPEITQKEIDKILAQIKQLGANDTKAQETLAKILTSIKDMSEKDEKGKTALVETVKKLLADAQISQKTQTDAIITLIGNGQKATGEALDKGVKAILEQIAKLPSDSGAETQKLIKELSQKITSLDSASQKAILEAISKLSNQKVMLDETSILKITQSVAKGFEKIATDDEISQKAMLNAISKISEQLKSKKEISIDEIRKVVSDCIGTIDFKGKTALDSVVIANIVANCTKTIEQQNGNAFIKISQEIASQLDKNSLEGKKSLDEITKLITKAMQEAGDKGETKIEITQENIEKIITGIKDGLKIEATGEISAENLDKIITAINEKVKTQPNLEITAENLNKIIEEIKTGLKIETTSVISQENIEKIITGIKDGLKIEATGEISAENLDKIIKAVKENIETQKTVEITQENIEKIIAGIKDGLKIEATGEISAENLDKIITAINENFATQSAKKAYIAPAIDIKKTYSKPEIVIKKASEKIAQKEEPILLLEAPKLSRVKFEKGVAYGLDGEKYTGIIEDTLKSGDKIQLEIKDGLIQKSTKTRQNGERLFEKTYERTFMPEKNIQKTMITRADDSNIERVYTSFNQNGTKNHSFNIAEKHLDKMVKKEVTRFEANDKGQTLIKALPNGQMIYSKSFVDGSAKLCDMKPATQYKEIGRDSKGFKVLKIDV